MVGEAEVSQMHYFHSFLKVMICIIQTFKWYLKTVIYWLAKLVSSHLLLLSISCHVLIQLEKTLEKRMRLISLVYLLTVIRNTFVILITVNKYKNIE